MTHGDGSPESQGRFSRLITLLSFMQIRPGTMNAAEKTGGQKYDDKQ